MMAWWKTVSGTALPGDYDGTLGESSFACPNGVALDRDGNLFVADTLNNVIQNSALCSYLQPLGISQELPLKYSKELLRKYPIKCKTPKPAKTDWAKTSGQRVGRCRTDSGYIGVLLFKQSNCQDNNH